MLKKVYYLSSCSTCARIMGGLPLDSFEKKDIKSDAITPGEIDEMMELSGSYESLFSRVALKYRAWNLKEKNLTESDYRKYILDEYTFLKRPVFVIGEAIFIGNSKKNIEALHTFLKSL